MSYQRERDAFIAKASSEGLDLATITKLLRYASTLQRLAVAQCNGDWPYNGDRDRPLPRNEATEQHDKLYTVCPKCEASGVAKSAMRKPAACEECTDQKESRRFCKHQICPDCRTQELVTALLNLIDPGCKCGTEDKFKAVFGGDPRGAVLKLSTPNYPYDECGKNGARGLYVPARER